MEELLSFTEVCEEICKNMADLSSDDLVDLYNKLNYEENKQLTYEGDSIFKLTK